MAKVTVELSAHVQAHLQEVSPPHKDELEYEQGLVLLIPIQHLPALPQRPAAKSESARDSNLAKVPFRDREAQAAEAPENGKNFVWREKQRPEGAAKKPHGQDEGGRKLAGAMQMYLAVLVHNEST